MNERADEAAARGRLRRHGRTILLALLAGVLAVLCATGRPDGLTTYVLFLLVLATSALASLAGRLVRLPEFGRAFAAGGFLTLLGMTGCFYICGLVSQPALENLEPRWFGSVFLVLWLTWVFPSLYGSRFWQQAAWAVGTCWGAIAARVAFVYLQFGHDPHTEWGVLFLAGAFLGALFPAAFLAASLPCWAVVRFLGHWRARRQRPPADTRYFAWPSKPEGSNRLQFRLRSVLLVILAVSIGLGWFRSKQVEVRRQREVAKVIDESFGAPNLRTVGGSGRPIRYRRTPTSLARPLGSMTRREDSVFVPYWVRRTIGHEHRVSSEIYLWSGPNSERALACLSEDFLGEVHLYFIDPFDDRAMPYVAEVRKLKSLDLGGNPITDAGLAHLRDHTELEFLNLRGTSVTAVGLQNLRAMTDLWWLDLGDNERVTDAALAHLASLSQLQCLFLADTGITDQGLIHLRNTPHLRTLDLSGTSITDVGLQHLANLRELERLVLANTATSDLGLACLRHLPKLSNLVLQNTQVTDLGLAHLKDFDSLDSIDLRGTRVTDRGLPYLAARRDLHIDLRHTSVTPARIASLLPSDPQDPFGRVLGPDDPD